MRRGSKFNLESAVITTEALNNQRVTTPGCCYAGELQSFALPQSCQQESEKAPVVNRRSALRHFTASLRYFQDVRDDSNIRFAEDSLPFVYNGRDKCRQCLRTLRYQR